MIRWLTRRCKRRAAWQRPRRINAQGTRLAPDRQRRWVDQVTGLDQNQVRAGILKLLELLGDAAAQERYEREVPIGNVPAELVCMWFDDSYLPESPAFRSAFTAAELRLLAEFNRFYDSRASSLPSSGGVRGLHRSNAWAEIMVEAAAVRARIR